jgi:hypothetical protein
MKNLQRRTASGAAAGLCSSASVPEFTPESVRLITPSYCPYRYVHCPLPRSAWQQPPSRSALKRATSRISRPSRRSS